MTTVTLRAWMTLLCFISAGSARAETSLYLRLGGGPGIAVIADTLIDRVAAHAVTGPSFKDTKLARIKRLLAEQICDLSGGPCRYSGDPMKEVHAGHRISEAQFYVMVEQLRAILAEQHVALGARNELLRLLAPMKRDVVEHAKVKTTAAPTGGAKAILAATATPTAGATAALTPIPANAAAAATAIATAEATDALHDSMARNAVAAGHE